MPTSGPLVSVVMPSYNHEKFVDSAISSVKSQTLDNWELIIVDDHSQDGSAAIIKERVSRDSRMKAVFHSRNEGIAKTVNEGIRLAKGKYVSLMASDDMYTTDALQRMTSILEHNYRFGAVITEAVVIDEKGEPTGKTVSDMHGRKPALKEGSFFDELISRNFVTGNTFRIGLIQEHGIHFDQELELANDWLFWLDLSAVSDFIYISEPLYYYRVHPLNSARSPKLVKDFMTFPEKVCSKHAKLLDFRKRMTLLGVAAYYGGEGSFNPAPARRALYQSIIMDFRELELERDRAKSKLSEATAERDDLHDKLLRSIAEADEIKASFGYRAMRFCATKFDRVSPDGTRRGEIRRILVRSVHVTMNQGLMSLISQAWSKVKRKEFMIATPTSQGVRTGRPANQLFLRCERPGLSTKKTAKVGPSFILSGWAVAESGIKQIEVTLDGIPLGLASYGQSRPDIGLAHPSFLDPSRSGFFKLISLTNESEHILRVVATSMDGSSATVEGPIQVEQRRLITAKPGRTGR